MQNSHGFSGQNARAPLQATPVSGVFSPTGLMSSQIHCSLLLTAAPMTSLHRADGLIPGYFSKASVTAVRLGLIRD